MKIASQTEQNLDTELFVIAATLIETVKSELNWRNGLTELGKTEGNVSDEKLCKQWNFGCWVTAMNAEFTSENY